VTQRQQPNASLPTPISSAYFCLRELRLLSNNVEDSTVAFYNALDNDKNLMADQIINLCICLDLTYPAKKDEHASEFTLKQNATMNIAHLCWIWFSTGEVTLNSNTIPVINTPESAESADSATTTEGK
jgi:hypothetical protein